MNAAHLEALLAPISPEQPGGTDASYSTEFDEIRKLRKGDDPSLSQGEWVQEIRSPQWPKVRDLCETILLKRSKDLQAGCWYMEALSQLEGFSGASFGLKVLDGLLARFAGAGLFPEDSDEQIAKLEWLNAEVPLVIKRIPMTSPKVGGYSQLKWEESRLVENLGVRNPQAKEAAIAEGKLAGDAWDKAASASGQAFYLRLFEQIQEAKTGFDAFEKRVDTRFAQDSPSLGSLREAIDGCSDLAGQMLKRFGLDPRVEASAAAAPTLQLDAPAQTIAAPAMPSGPVPSRAEALRRLREVAKYYRDHEPHSPVGPLVERAARWGEMPLSQWLTRVVKDEATLNQLRELLDLDPEL
jgi:type VI secretion system protein ImpA